MNVGDLVLVRRRLDRLCWLRVRVLGDGWLIGHRPVSGLCRWAWTEDVVRVEPQA